SFTSSSLKGLITASIFFMGFPSLADRDGVGRLWTGPSRRAQTVSRVRAKPGHRWKFAVFQ
ncbi:MAG: hypothetical protein C5B56_06815, partial [Proteobacteria bacterium]